MIDNPEYKAAVGIGQPLILTARKATVQKRLPIDSRLLSDDKKKDIAVGTVIEAHDWELQDLHIRASLADGVWYFFAEHFVLSFPEPKELVNFDQLAAIAIHCPLDRIRQLLPHINATMAEYSINTPLRICHFLAQICHESDGLNTTREYASGADYEWREDLGNIYAGDGVRFRGRGLVQITGRYNFSEVGKALGIDLIANPDRLEDFDLAARSAGWFWDSRNLNHYADADDFDRIMRIINGSNNGEIDRWNYLVRAKDVFNI
jgi:predicted chitinase